MEKPTADTIAYYDQGVPADARAVKGQMFGHPCAFVNGHMFFGTFAQTVMVRVGLERTEELTLAKPVAGKRPAIESVMRVFEPMPGRPWREYVQLDAGALPVAKLRALAAEALEMTALLAPKPKKSPAGKRPPSAAGASPASARTQKAPAKSAR